jgi:hypothetical protein
MIDVEFTDRYSPGHAPSWLRGCFADCEATGHVPVRWVEFDAPENGHYRALWEQAHNAAVTADPMHERTCDGWHFVICPACHGNGTVSRWRSLARVPRWVAKGARILWNNARDPYMRAPWTTTRQWYWLLIKTAYLYDLGWPHRP